MSRAYIILILTLSTTCVYGQTKQLEQTTTDKPFVLGVIAEIQSKELDEKRILNIYLPEGYNQNDTIQYPVIYLLDGSANEDFIHIVGLVQFYTFEWVDLIPKSIVVGIANTDRIRDFTFPTTIEKYKKSNPTSGHSDKFISFIEEELQPYIAAKYNTNNSTTIIGQSLGGLLATEILLNEPSLFDTYIIISPSLWWNNGSLLNQDFPSFKNKDIYIGVGKEGLTPTAIPRVMEVDANILADKIKSIANKNVNVYFDYLPLENHATIMHQAVSNAFRLLKPNNTKE